MVNRVITAQKSWALLVCSVGIHYRALAVGVEDGMLWFWIGSHADYDKLINA